MSNDPTTTPFPMRHRRRHWVHILLSLVILLCGMGLGAGLTVILLFRHVQGVIHHPDQFPTHLTGMLRGKLDLTDQQAANVEKILRVHQKNIQRLRAQHQPLFEAELDRIEADISAVLDAKQAVKWHAWLQEKRSNWLPALPASEPTSGPGTPEE